MQFISSGYMDFEKVIAKRGNYFHGNIIMPDDQMISFSFPGELQSYTFYLQKLIFDSDTMQYTWDTPIALSNTYKKTLYFEQHTISTLDVGYYRIIAGSGADFYSVSLLDVRDIEAIAPYTFLVDDELDTLRDNVGDDLVEPII